jgi:hypothetical protein
MSREGQEDGRARTECNASKIPNSPRDLRLGGGEIASITSPVPDHALIASRKARGCRRVSGGRSIVRASAAARWSGGGGRIGGFGDLAFRLEGSSSVRLGLGPWALGNRYLVCADQA